MKDAPWMRLQRSRNQNWELRQKRSDTHIKTIEENNAHYILSNKLNQINLEIQNNCLDYKEYLMNHLSKIHGNLVIYFE